MSVLRPEWGLGGGVELDRVFHRKLICFFWRGERLELNFSYETQSWEEGGKIDESVSLSVRGQVLCRLEACPCLFV